MIPIFKKARLKLIRGGRLQRYLTYAVGEIILVVIGILIALQFRNLNEARKTSQYENRMLSYIAADLRQEEKDLKAIIDRRQSKAASARLMASYHRKGEVDTLRKYYTHFANVLYWEVHHPNDQTFRELMNAGNLSLIENKAIKGNLLEMQNQYSQIAELREHMKEDYTLFFYREYKDIFEFSLAIQAWAQPEGKYEFSSAEVEKCLARKTIANGYTLAAFNNDDLGRRSREVLQLAEQTITLIEEEIEP